MLTNVKINNGTDLYNLSPLDDDEAEERMSHFGQLLNELEWSRVMMLASNLELTCNRIKLKAREAINQIEEFYRHKEKELVKETKIEIGRLSTRGRLKVLEEMDKQVTNVIMAVHHRLGRIDHHEHKRAYKRILYALIVQALCRLLEPEAVLVFRMSDVALGKSVLAPAQAKYKEITGLEVALQTDPVNCLPLESCGGVNVCSPGGGRTVTNTLAGRLDNLLFKFNPVIRIVLYGPNPARRFFDLSDMCGSIGLFRRPQFSTEGKMKRMRGKSGVVEDHFHGNGATTILKMLSTEGNKSSGAESSEEESEPSSDEPSDEELARPLPDRE